MKQFILTKEAHNRFGDARDPNSRGYIAVVYKTDKPKVGHVVLSVGTKPWTGCKLLTKCSNGDRLQHPKGFIHIYAGTEAGKRHYYQVEEHKEKHVYSKG